MVLKYLNEDEILKVAINVEKEGIEFYRKSASFSKVEKAKVLFKYLADQEEKHLEYFTKLDKKIEYIKFIPGEIDDEISMYLKSLVDTGIFSNKFTENDWKKFTDKKALEFGINIEKNSILFYSDVLKITENESAIKSLKKIIDEEKKHLIVLTTHLGE